MNVSGDGVKVSTFLGVDVYFRSGEGKFQAAVGGQVAKGKTIDEVEKQIAEGLRVKGTVDVVDKPYFYEGRVPSLESIKPLNKKTVVGFNVERGRGRGATKSVEYEFASGARGNVSRAYCRWNEEVAKEMEELVSEKNRVLAELAEKGRAILERLEVVTSEQIFDELMKGSNEGKLRRVV